MNKSLRATIVAICVIAIIVSLIFIVFFVKEKNSYPDAPDDDITVDDILNAKYVPIELEENGVKVKYDHNRDVKNYLFMGIDKDGEAVSSGSYNDGGQADAIFVLSINYTDRSFSVLQINRDTMAEVDELDFYGKVSNTLTMQIAIAHFYGDGLEKSCLNTVKAVSRYLYGTTFAGYAAMNMDGIRKLNDAVGGVEVLVEDDFSESDPTLLLGERIKLNGNQAYNFLRARGSVGEGTNLERMNRHSQYVDEFMKSLKSGFKDDSSIASDLYKAIEKYTVTNLSLNDFINLFTDLQHYENKGIVKIDGETKLGEEFMEFYPYKESLESVIKSLFFHKA